MSLAATFGANVARAREQAGYSQEELGFRAGLHRTEVGMLERGARLGRIDTFVKLLGALDVSPDVLLAGLTWTPGIYREGGFSTDDGATLSGDG